MNEGRSGGGEGYMGPGLGPDFILEEMRSHRLSEHSHYVETVTTGLHGK